MGRNIAYEALTVSTTAIGPTAATITALVRSAIYYVDGAAVRWRADGTAPTASVGFPIENKGHIIIYGEGNCRNIQFIRRDGVNATVHCLYFDQVDLGVVIPTAAVEGTVAHDAVDSGNPIKIGGIAETTDRTAVADGDRVDAWFDEFGKLVVLLGGRGSGTEASTIVTTRDDGNDAVTGLLSLDVNAHAYLYSGASRDRQRGVLQATNYIAASLVSATQNGADRVNYNHRGLAIFVDFTVRTGTGTLTPALQLKDGNSNYKTIWTAAAALSATGQAMYLIYPTAENTESWTEMANSVLGGRTYRVIMTYGGADTVSFDVDLVELL